MIIRQATLDDSLAISRIALENKITFDDPNADTENGFLHTAMSDEKYRQFIQANPHCYVSEIEGVVQGFLTAHKISAMAANKSEDEYQLNLLANLNHYGSPNDICISQIAVTKAHQRLGIMAAIYEKFETELPHETIIFVKIVDTPVRNEASMIFFLKRQYQEINRIELKSCETKLYKKHKN